MLNTYYKAILRLSYTRTSVEITKQPWRGIILLETDSSYTVIIIADIAILKIWWVEELSTVLSFKPTRTSANLDLSHLYLSEIKFYKTYLQSWSIELVWLESKKINIVGLLAHFSSFLTNEVFVPNRSKTQDKQTLHHQWIHHHDESIDISYSRHTNMVKLTQELVKIQIYT